MNISNKYIHDTILNTGGGPTPRSHNHVLDYKFTILKIRVESEHPPQRGCSIINELIIKIKTCSELDCETVVPHGTTDI